MIPVKTLNLSSRYADVINGNLATEQHGTEKSAFIDLKFKFLLDHAEFDEWLGVDGFDLIFDDDNKFRIPGLKLTGAIGDLNGELAIEMDGIGKTTFDDAHTSGTTSELKAKIGGHGEVILQLRVRPGNHMDMILELIERGDCMIAFTELEGSRGKAKDQAEMPV